MTLSDDTLSAFLDQELTEAEMAAVREAIARDPAIADRLAELAMVDTRLQARYRAIDEQPMPEAVTALLGQTPVAAAGADNVIPLTRWRRAWTHAGRAIAAAVVAGVALGLWLSQPESGSEPAWTDIAEVLEHRAGGQAHPVGADVQVTPRLTFRSVDGDWCRQYRVRWPDQSAEQIACRADGQWRRIAQAQVPVDNGEYRAATGGNPLDQTLDQIMAGSPLTREQEQALLVGGWKEQH